MVPKGWSIKKLNQIAFFLDGKRQPIKSEDRQKIQGIYPYYGATGIIDWVNDYIFDDSLILLGEDGENILSRNLPHAFVIHGKTWVNNHAHVIKPHPNVDIHFLCAQLESIDYKKYNSGSAQPKLNKKICEEIPILVPPEAEQTKIAKILSSWDKAIAATERLLANSRLQKQALMQQLLTGQKRFAGLHGNWQTSDFSSLFLVKNDKKTQTISSNYLEQGKTPVVDQGQALIAGYTDSDQVYRDVPVIVFGDHTRAIKWVDFEFSPGADGTQILKVSDLLEARFGYYLLSNADIPNLGYSRHMRELKEIEFRYPADKIEQQKIAQVLTTADAEISNLQTQLAKLKLEKKALMQQLLTGQRRVQLDAEAVA